jgi:sigma54-dependent transcription regulator
LYLVRGADLKENLAQLYSRVGLKLDSIPRLVFEEVKAVCQDRGITNTAAQREVMRQCNGNFRKTDKLLKRIARMCEIGKLDPAKVRKEDVKEGANFLVRG